MASAPSDTARPGDGWTPDFTAGACALEVESGLHRYLLVDRALRTGVTALRVASGRAAVDDRRLAAGALVAETAGLVNLYFRTRTWRTLRQPGVFSRDAVTGALASALALRAAATDEAGEAAEWFFPQLRTRLLTAPLSGRRGAEFVGSVGLPVVPLLLERRGGRRGGPLRAHGVEFVSSLLVGAFMGRVVRQQATATDARALQWANEDLGRMLAGERAEYDAILRPLPTALADLAHQWRHDRRGAATSAAALESRLRTWIRQPATLPPRGSDRFAELQRGYDQAARRFDAALRVAALTSVVPSIRPPVRSASGAGRVVAGAIALRAVAGIALGSDGVTDRFGERRVRRWTTATDLALVAAGLGVDRGAGVGEQRLDGVIDRLLAESFVHALGQGPGFTASFALATAVRTAAAARRAAAHHPVGSTVRLAAAGSAALAQLASFPLPALAANRTKLHLFERMEVLTSAVVEAVADHPDLVAERTRQRAFVHDGILQVLGAAAAGDLDDREMSAWIDRERVRIEAVTRVRSAGHGGDLTAELHGLIAEFEQRGLPILWQIGDVPEWVGEIAGTVAEIVREALNNAVKHGTDEAAWCGVLELDDGSVDVRIINGSTSPPTFRPGSGTGTSTMLGLAAMIDAEIDWRHTLGDRVELRLTLRPPAPGRPEPGRSEPEADGSSAAV